MSSNTDCEEPKPGIKIKYRVGDCSFGKGIFAEEDILKGTLVHVQRIGANIRLIGGEKELLDEISQLPDKKAKKEFLEHTLAHDGKIYQPMNDWTYVNHSDEPNIHNGDVYDHDYAIRDIKKGDMIVEDYYKRYDHPEWLMKLIAEYDVDERFY